jgi:flavin-dependent dehydrogenase
VNDTAISSSFRISDDPGDIPLMVVSRKTLDSALIDAATNVGARLIPERVQDLVAGPDGVTIRTATGSHRTSFVIGADGPNSIVRRRVLAPFTREQLSLATGFYIGGITSSEVVVNCVAEPPGYLWSFPRPDHLAVGICAQADLTRTATLRAAAAAWIQREFPAGGGHLQKYGWLIPSLPYADCATQSPAGSRWLLVGDAAGLVDPLTREGIFFALHSGRLAADALGSQSGADELYATRLNDEVYPELRRAAALKAGFFTSRFADLMVDALERSGPVRSIMVDLIAGRQSYRTLRRRLLATLEVGLAWRLLRLQIEGMVA